MLAGTRLCARIELKDGYRKQSPMPYKREGQQLGVAWGSVLIYSRTKYIQKPKQKPSYK